MPNISSKDGFIHRVIRKNKNKYNTASSYRFVDADDPLTIEETALIGYFQENIKLLEGDGIADTEILAKLELKEPELEQTILVIMQKLKEDEKHFMHRIASSARNNVTFYHFANVDSPLTIEETALIGYFQKNIERLLESGGIADIEILERFKLKDNRELGGVLKKLKDKLPEGHFIRRIKYFPGNRKQKYVYRFADVITDKEKNC